MQETFQPPFIVNTQITRKDYVSLAGALHAAPKGLYILVAIIALLVFFKWSETGFLGIWGWVFCAGAIITFMPLARLTAYFNYKKQPIADIQLVTTVDDTGIIIDTPNSHSSMGWDLVQKVIETKDYLFPCISSIQAVIIPQRDMDAAAYEALKIYIAQKIPADTKWKKR